MCPCLQLLFLNIALTGATKFCSQQCSKENVLICFTVIINEQSVKTNKFELKLRTSRVSFLIDRDTTTFAMQIFWFHVKIELGLSKNKNHFVKLTLKGLRLFYFLVCLVFDHFMGLVLKGLSPFYHFIIHYMGVLHSFSIKNIFYDKMDLRLFYFHVMTWLIKSLSKKVVAMSSRIVDGSFPQLCFGQY